VVSAIQSINSIFFKVHVL